MKIKYHIGLIVFGILVAVMCIMQHVNKPTIHGKEPYLSILPDTEGKLSFGAKDFK